MDRFVVNDTVTVTNTFKVSGTATDPTTVTLAVTSPDGSTTTYTYAAAEITKSSTGVYTKNITASSAGTWRYKWTGTGAAADVQDSSFDVFTGSDITAYASIEELRDELGNYESTDQSDDAKMQRSIDAASRMIDGWCGQRFWIDSTATARTFTPTDSRTLDLVNDAVDGDGTGIATTTGLIVKLDTTDSGTYGTTLTVDTDYLLRPSNAAVVSPAKPYTEVALTGVDYLFSGSSYGRPLVQITAKWGWPAVPADVKKACLIQAIDLFKSKDAAFGVAGVADLGVLRVNSGLHRIARALLEPYRRPAIG